MKTTFTEFWQKNWKLVILALFLLILNGCIFNDLFSARRPDLYIQDVSPLSSGIWQVRAAASRSLPTQQAEVEVFFSSDRVEREIWNLEERHFSREYKSSVPVERVRITAPVIIDWNRENSSYQNPDLWGQENRLTALPAAAYRFLTPLHGRSFFLIYSDYNSDGDVEKIGQIGSGERASSLLLKEFDLTGESRLCTEPLYSTTSRISRPFLHITSSTEEGFRAAAGWNLIRKDTDYSGQNGGITPTGIKIEYGNGELESEALFAEEDKDEGDKNEEDKNEGDKNNWDKNEYRIYDTCQAEKSSDWYLLAGGPAGSGARAANGRGFNWIIHHYSGLKLIDKISVPCGKPLTPLAPSDTPELGRLIPEEDGFHIFWANRVQTDDILYYQKVSPQGGIIIPAKESLKVNGLRYTNPGDLQMIRSREGYFHLGWIEFVRGMKVTRILNYQLIGSAGEPVKNGRRIVENTSGFNLKINPSGNVDLYTATSNGNFGTDIFRFKYSPDFQEISPRQLIISSRGYEESPEIFYTEGGHSLLTWAVDRGERDEIRFSTTDPDLKGLISESRPTLNFSSLLEGGTRLLLAAVIGTIFCLFLNFLPLIALVIYNYLGRYRRNNFLFWLTAFLLLFPIKLYNQTVIIKWGSPLLSHLYQYQLLFLGVLLAAVSLYWFYRKKTRHYRTVFINRAIIVWLLMDSFYIFFNYFKDIYIA